MMSSGRFFSSYFRTSTAPCRAFSDASQGADQSAHHRDRGGPSRQGIGPHGPADRHDLPRASGQRLAGDGTPLHRRGHAFRDHLALITTSVVCRLLAVPAIAWGAVTLAGLDPVEAGVAILFAALPTAQSCYVMTASMKGDAPSVANSRPPRRSPPWRRSPSGSRRSSSASRPSRAETGIRERQMHERPQDRVSLRASHCPIRDEVRPTRGVARASEEACGGSILPSRRRPGARGTCGLRRA